MSAVTNYWPTPIYRTNINDPLFVSELLPRVIDINRHYHPKFADLYRTDHSTMQDVFAELYSNKDDLIIRTYDLIDRHVRQFYKDGFGICDIPVVIKMWGQVYYQAEHLPYHNHESILTGVLYLQVPEAEVHFHDPRGNANRGYPSQFDDIGFFDTIKVLPVAGDIVIFPSYLFHSVMTNMSRHPRVVVPFDTYVQ